MEVANTFGHCFLSFQNVFNNFILFFSLGKEEDLLSSCGYIFFFPDSVYGAKGWRISLGEKLYTCENGSPDCGDYFYRSMFFMN